VLDALLQDVGRDHHLSQRGWMASDTPLTRRRCRDHHLSQRRQMVPDTPFTRFSCRDHRLLQIGQMVLDAPFAKLQCRDHHLLRRERIVSDAPSASGAVQYVAECGTAGCTCWERDAVPVWYHRPNTPYPKGAQGCCNPVIKKQNLFLLTLPAVLASRYIKY
jgi:hypothetical protein